jgi:hypothetical protein
MVKGTALHIVRRRADGLALAVMAAQSRERGVEVVLVQDGVFADMPPSFSVCVSDEDAAARGIDTQHRRVGYDDIARMVCDAASVTVW